MKNLFIIFIGLLFIASCKDPTPDTYPDIIDPNDKLLVGVWIDKDQYLEYKVENSELNYDTTKNILLHIEEDGSYSVDNECDFGLPLGSGNWTYDKSTKVVIFNPSQTTFPDDTLHYYWKNLEFIENGLNCDFYLSKYSIDSIGQIKSNRIPRNFIKQ